MAKGKTPTGSKSDYPVPGWSGGIKILRKEKAYDTLPAKSPITTVPIDYTGDTRPRHLSSSSLSLPSSFRKILVGLPVVTVFEVYSEVSVAVTQNTLVPKHIGMAPCMCKHSYTFAGSS